MWRGISLANKCILLFGAAIVLIVTAALAAPWIRMNAIVAETQLELSRQLVTIWQQSTPSRQTNPESIPARRLAMTQWLAEAQHDPFLEQALQRFQAEQPPVDFQDASWRGAARRYQYARPIMTADPPNMAVLSGVIVLDRLSADAARLLALNAAYHLGAGIIVFALAVLVFYLITSRIILEPVRVLRSVAQRAGQGELSIRAQLRTGDEFEQFGDAFNTMLAHVQTSQDQLRSINKALDLKVGELANANVALYQAAKLKGEFVAGVSHELRTPLNSIIGFAELLLEIAQAESAAGDDSTRQRKRLRYLDNILGSSRHLLDMIDTLLEMAKIEAGKAELKLEPVRVRQLCDSLLGLMEPLARRQDIDLAADLPDDLPDVRTDRTKLQQILFNFLSNAVKFTGRASSEVRPTVTLRAERLRPSAQDPAERVRISVIDTGPGIDAKDHQRIFDKFQQADAGLTRQHEGTGLGLAISKELASLIQGEIQLVSELGRGSMFSLIIPVELDPSRLHETELERGFRAALARTPASIKTN